jgi:hypothetical protein
MKSQYIPMIIAIMFLETNTNGQNQGRTIPKTKNSTTEQKKAPDTLIVFVHEPAKQDKVVAKIPDWKGIHIGGFAQATFTDIKVDGEYGEVSTSYAAGYGAGGFIGYFCSPHVEIRMEALYSSLAQELKIRESNHRLELSYINFPVLVGFHTGYDRPVNLNVMFGPQIGINTGTSLERSGGEGSDTIQATIKIKPADIGLAYGAGLDFGFGKEKLVHFNVGFRGVDGIVDISDESNNSATNTNYILGQTKLITYSGYAGLSFKF